MFKLGIGRAFDFINDLWNMFIPQTRMMIVLTLLIIGFCFIYGRKAKKANPMMAPEGSMIIVEWFIELMNDFTKSFFGKKYRYFAPLMIVIVVIITLSITVSIMGFASPFNSLWICIALGLNTFIWIHFTGMFSNGFFNYWKQYMFLGKIGNLPWFLNIPVLIIANCALIPFNLIGEIATPISLGLRLFGNLLSGALVMILIYGVVGMLTDMLGIFGYLTYIVPPLFHAVFDIFFGLIQVYVFALLSSIFISNKIKEGTM